MSKHTPGPWRVVENRVPASLEIYARETAIVECWRRADVQTEMANARLIAAAPDLLDALVMVLDDPNALDGRPRTYEIVCAAIAKAKGGV